MSMSSRFSVLLSVRGLAVLLPLVVLINESPRERR